MKLEDLNEDARALLRRIVESQAYRQLMAANIRGHALKLVRDPEEKIALVDDLQKSLVTIQAVVDLYERLQGDVPSAVRHKMDRIPYPNSRLEVALCLALCDRAEKTAAESYRDSSCEEFAEISRAQCAVERLSTQHGEALFVEYCEEPGNRPHAQQMFNRWLSICLLSLGRPDSPGDKRARELGLRSRSSADSVMEFLTRVRSFARRSQLAIPTGASLSLELPQQFVSETIR